MFNKKDMKRDQMKLAGSLAKKGYDWWWHSFTAQDAETGEDKPFFVEFFLCNPALITLYRYDFLNGSILCDILQTYLLNNRSVERTAQKCYMHRNTIKSKLELIQQITPLDLDDPEVFISLIISFRLINYYGFYAGGAIDDAKKNY